MIENAYRWKNGMVMVFDQHGEQVPDWQGPYTEELHERLRAEGAALHGFPPEEALAW